METRDYHHVRRVPRARKVSPTPAAEVSVAVNTRIASRLEEVAGILEDQGANPYRIAAYRRAADTVRAWPQPIVSVAAEGGLAGLSELPGIGDILARAIYQLATSGHLPMLDRLRGESDPVRLFGTLPGIGRSTVRRLHEQLGIHTLEELELAAHDGRLQGLGIGRKRLNGIRDALAGRLGRVDRRAPVVAAALPEVAEILDVDRQYRSRASDNSLPMIAPRRFNPTHEAWLPVLHTQRGSRHYTALFSNTARAHELGRTHDWVILYFDGQDGERQCTVITAERGPLRGRRIVPGREGECLQHYERHEAQVAGH